MSEMKWYVVHTQTGSEEKAKAGLESRMVSTDLKKYVGEIVVPTEQVSEVRGGKKQPGGRCQTRVNFLGAFWADSSWDSVGPWRAAVTSATL